jgi:hypothetical protein
MSTDDDDDDDDDNNNNNLTRRAITIQRQRDKQIYQSRF